MKISLAEPTLPRTGALVVGVSEGRALSPTAAAVDGKTGGALRRALKSGRFRGTRNQILELLAPNGLGASRVVMVGLGKARELDALAAQGIGGTIVGHLGKSGESAAAVAVDSLKGGKLKAVDWAANIAYGARLGSYRFDRYRTREKADKKPSLRTLNVMVKDSKDARRLFSRLDKIADGVFLTRDLVSEPANVLYPESLARQARGLGKLGLKVEVLGRARMEKLGMGALLGVAQGSLRQPQLVVMRWDGAPRGSAARGLDKQPLAIVGKGVTFDSGGISIKPSKGMEDMKWDMGGAGTVIGLMRALAGRKAKANVVGVVGLVENMPSGSAQRPGDVVTSASGQTIEVVNTDAEGRLVLADALWYTQRRFKPKAMIDLATLTGAIIVSLGHVHAGLFSDNDKLSQDLAAAGQAEGELVWRFPLHVEYDKEIDCDIADMKNVGSGGGAGSITGAQFLKRFTNNVPWAHLDIAGMAWSKKGKPTVPKGGTGFGVRLLDRLVADRYEPK
jgi:leucyl aminopeptidase